MSSLTSDTNMQCVSFDLSEDKYMYLNIHNLCNSNNILLLLMVSFLVRQSYRKGDIPVVATG